MILWPLTSVVTFIVKTTSYFVTFIVSKTCDFVALLFDQAYNVAQYIKQVLVGAISYYIVKVCKDWKVRRICPY